jgi:Zn finger protein HypA/HybF involved in hydrogenase expression
VRGVCREKTASVLTAKMGEGVMPYGLGTLAQKTNMKNNKRKRRTVTILLHCINCNQEHSVSGNAVWKQIVPNRFTSIRCDRCGSAVFQVDVKRNRLT